MNQDSQQAAGLITKVDLKAGTENNSKIGIGDVTFYYTVHIIVPAQLFCSGNIFLFNIAGLTDVNAKYTREVQVDKYRAVQGRFSTQHTRK